MKQVKVEWCENFIMALFAKLPEGVTGIYTELFWEKAVESGLYERGTYGAPMSEALMKLVKVESKCDEYGNYLYDVFRLV